mgnify:CR=1 FL=1
MRLTERDLRWAAGTARQPKAAYDIHLCSEEELAPKCKCLVESGSRRNIFKPCTICKLRIRV